MFEHRSVPAGHFSAGEKVWVVYNGRVREASIACCPVKYPSGGLLTVCIFGMHGTKLFKPSDVFKRPSEYHLLKAAVADLIEDLQRDCRDLLVASS